MALAIPDFRTFFTVRLFHGTAFSRYGFSRYGFTVRSAPANDNRRDGLRSAGTAQRSLGNLQQ
ncbi:MAG: hypothetical protein CMJ59_09870 [Planctomycetaceae bacterium]|nr:hypothetical protein [Planctomycetaceae bacterium]